MVQIGSSLEVLDNCGAKSAVCINILGGYNQKVAHVGDLVLVVVKELQTDKPKKKKRKKSQNNNANLILPASKVKRGEMHRGIIIHTQVFNKSLGNLYMYDFESGVALLDKQNHLIGTRLNTEIPEKFRYNKFLKLVICSKGIIR